jgi:hypothetical protein
MDFEQSIDKIREGFTGEAIVREYLKKQKDCIFMQLDIMAKIRGKWYSIEIKHQEMFKSPPFDGHGLPKYQVEMRLMLHKELEIIPLLFVLDKVTKKMYYNSLINLEAGNKFITKNKGRVVYPLENFVELHY